MREGMWSSEPSTGHTCPLPMACGDKDKRGVETGPTTTRHGCWVGWGWGERRHLGGNP